jgi:hypothetical protein
MAQQIINVGTAPNDGLGDPIRTSFIKTNDNFTELYARAQVSPPDTLVGTLGDEAGMYAYSPTYFYYCFADYDGSSVIWAEVTQIGNISVTQVTNGTSNVLVALNGNVSIGTSGTANLAVFSTSGQTLNGNLSATGNVTGNFILGDGSQLTNLPIPGIYGNTQVAAYLPTYTGNLAGGNLSVTGNATATYFIGDGSQLTNISGNVSVSGIQNGLSQVNIPVSSGNVKIDVGVISNLAVFSTAGLNLTGNLVATNLTATSNISAVGAVVASTLTGALQTASQTNITSVGTLGTLTVTGTTTGGNLLTAGYVSATGNITGAYLYGNGYYLSGITAGGGNGQAIVNGLTTVDIPVNSGNVAVTVGFSSNVVVITSSSLNVNGNIIGSNITTPGLISATGTINGGNLVTPGYISAVCNVTGTYFIGNGSLLTGITASGSTYSISYEVIS